MSRKKGMTKRVFLWTCPRSCSSVFLRSIDTLSTTHAISEPFRFAFHFGPERQSQRYTSQPVDGTKSYEAVTKWILDQPLNDRENVVFVKEMARYLKGRLSILEESFADAKHSFLIRNPQKVLKSQYKASTNPEIQSGSNWTYFDPDDAGFKELYELYRFVKDNLDANPVIIDADDLLDSPNQMMKAYCDGVGIQYEDHMTTWKAGEVPQAFMWDGECLSWYSNAINSSCFKKEFMPEDSTASAPDITFPLEVFKGIEYSRPFYERLYSERVTLF